MGDEADYLEEYYIDEDDPEESEVVTAVRRCRGTKQVQKGGMKMTDALKTDYELKPCPFCGGKAEYTKVGNSYIGIKEATIECTKCHVKRTQRFINKKFCFEWIDSTMIDSWNRRAESEKV